MSAVIPIRKEASYVPQWKRFEKLPASLTSPDANNNNNPYAHQYSGVYSARLAMLRDRCLEAAAMAFRNNTETEDNDGDHRNVQSPKVVSRIIEVTEEELSTIVGTVVKETPDRPAVDTSYHSSTLEATSYLGIPYDNNDSNDPDSYDKDGIKGLRTYCNGNNDGVVLEDESGRVELVSSSLAPELQFAGEALDIHSLTTGVVVAVTGVVKSNTGIMEVRSVHFPQPLILDKDVEECDDPMQDGDYNVDGNSEESPLIMLVSGLHCGAPDKPNSSTSLKRDLLLDYLSGSLASNFTPEPKNISRVIVAGGGCAKPSRPDHIQPYRSWDTHSNATKKDPIATNKSTSSSSLPIRELDLFLSQICAMGVHVDYIPGLHDPTNANWPQKGLHPCLLPTAGTYCNMLSRCTNPYQAEIEGKIFLGSDGLNIVDLRRFIAAPKDYGDGSAEDTEDVKDDKSTQSDENESETKTLETVSALQALRSSLKFHHIAPTGPDSLPTFPFKSFDPFVIEKTPNIYFAGNCEKFETTEVEVEDVMSKRKTSSRLICIPSFAETGEVVLMNLKTLKCRVLQFDDVCEEYVEFDDDEKKMEL